MICFYSFLTFHLFWKTLYHTMYCLKYKTLFCLTYCNLYFPYLIHFILPDIILFHVTYQTRRFLTGFTLFYHMKLCLPDKFVFFSSHFKLYSTVFFTQNMISLPEIIPFILPDIKHCLTWHIKHCITSHIKNGLTRHNKNCLTWHIELCMFVSEVFVVCSEE